MSFTTTTSFAAASFATAPAASNTATGRPRRDRRSDRADRARPTWQRFDAHAMRAQAPRWW